MAHNVKKLKDKSMRYTRLNFMKKSPHIFTVLICLMGSLLNSCVAPEQPHLIATTTTFIEDKPSIDVCFSPEGNCQPIILHLIKNAKFKILVQSYSFTSKAIANALIQAHQKGVKVRILFDRSQLTAKYSQIHKMREAGIECLVDPVPGIAHNKVMIIDKDIVLTGSYNWTNAAEMRNAENLLIIKNRPTVEIYKRNWQKRYERAKEINLQGSFKKVKHRKTKTIKSKYVHH